MAQEDILELHLTADARNRRSTTYLLVFGLLGIALIGFGVDNIINPRPQDQPGVGWFPLGMGVLQLLFGLAGAIGAPEAGRLRFHATWFELTRQPVPPWCFLTPPRFQYAEVKRWGVSDEPPGTPSEVLAFEIRCAESKGSVTKTLNFSDYPPNVVAEFHRRLPPPVRVKVEDDGTVKFAV